MCCGFGGLFSVKMPELSGAMLARKIGNIRVTAADQVVGWDIPCIAHINGGLEKQGAPQRVQHIAEVLAESIRVDEDGQ